MLLFARHRWSHQATFEANPLEIEDVLEMIPTDLRRGVPPRTHMMEAFVEARRGALGCDALFGKNGGILLNNSLSVSERHSARSRQAVSARFTKLRCKYLEGWFDGRSRPGEMVTLERLLHDQDDSSLALQSQRHASFFGNLRLRRGITRSDFSCPSRFPKGFDRLSEALDGAGELERVVRLYLSHPGQRRITRFEHQGEVEIRNDGLL